MLRLTDEEAAAALGFAVDGHGALDFDSDADLEETDPDEGEVSTRTEEFDYLGVVVFGFRVGNVSEAVNKLVNGRFSRVAPALGWREAHAREPPPSVASSSPRMSS
ncbi:hypothetical protein G3I44_14870 [Halogeometricum borinquense]|uniref:Uncharacterized protein n=1 Tax=Halogeometricum borinquense TaxID=60847 RepID=A0A6C0ULK1_9EURY|nr:hypothetical protein G3I44_14870 [Halogeometricum borinquense]